MKPVTEMDMKPKSRRFDAVLAGIALLSAFLNLFNIWNQTYANAYYTSAVTSMLQSFHNFFYASFDPGGFVTVDKPPVTFWVQTLFAYVFGVHGWSVILPQALAGVGSVLLMYALVKPTFGRTAARLSALIFACTPIAAAVARTNNVDSLLVFTLLLAVWMLMRGIRRASAGWIIAAFAMIGVGFNEKMLQAYMIVPALYVIFWIAFQSAWKKKLAVLGAATLVLGVVSLSWAVSVDSISKDSRPYIGSSQTNSVLELALGYNGISRLTGNGGPGGGNRDGLSRDRQDGASANAAGDGRRQTDGSAADNGAAAGQLPAGGSGPRGQNGSGGGSDGPGGMNGFGGPNGQGAPNGQSGPNGFPGGADGQGGPNGLPGGTDGQGAPNSFPGGTDGQGAPNSFPGNTGGQGAPAPGGFGGGPGGGGPGGTGGMFGTGQPGPLRLFQSGLAGQISWLLPFVVFGAAGLLSGWLSAIRRRTFGTDVHKQTIFWLAWLLPVAVFFSVAGFFHQYYLIMLAPPIAALSGAGWTALWEQYRCRTGWRTYLLPAGVAATAGVQLLILSYTSQAGWGWSAFVAAAGFGIALLLVLYAQRESRPYKPALAGLLVLLIVPLYWASTPMLYGGNSMIPEAGPQLQSSRGGAGGGGPGMGGEQINTALLQYVTEHNTGETFLFATSSSNTADPYIIQTGKAVMAMGGFSGSDPILTVDKLKKLVETKQVKYFLISGGGFGGPGGGGFGGPGGGSSELTEWIKQNGKEISSSEWQDTSASSGQPNDQTGGQPGQPGGAVTDPSGGSESSNGSAQFRDGRSGRNDGNTSLRQGFNRGGMGGMTLYEVDL